MNRRDLSLSSSAPSDWKYIAEGGACIVFSYVGPRATLFDGLALRLRKVTPNHTDQCSVDDPNSVDDPVVLFQDAVLCHLLPLEYLPRFEVTEADQAWLIELAELCDAQRPLERRLQGGIDISRSKATFVTDLVGKDGWVVEIKPKWGFLPSPAYLSPTTRPIKTYTCRFCMHTQLKGTQGSVSASEFCPLDLYSGDITRIQKALFALWDSWVASSGAINNLRVFVEGHILKPAATDPSSLAPLAIKLSPLSPSPSQVDLREAFATTLASILVKIPVLGTLSALQRNLDPLDIEGINALWDAAYTTADFKPPFGTGLSEPTMEEWTRFVGTFKSRHMDDSHTDFEKNEASLRYYCLAYLLSATFKDCSLIIRIPPSSRTDRDIDSAATVKIIDLDVKPISRLAKWRRLDDEIVAAYSKQAFPRHCVDARRD